MKILQFHTKMVSGGIEAVICGLANEMCKTEDVTLCTIFKPNADDVFYNKLSSSVKKTTMGKLKFGFSLREIFRIYTFIRNGCFDVVNVHGCFQYYFLAMLLLHKKTRFFYTIHSDARMENQKWDWRLFNLKRYMFAHGWVVPITISNISQKSFADLYHCSSELIYNGAPKPIIKNNSNIIEQLRISPKTKVFIHAGRISKPKNQLVLCRVFDRLIKERNDVILVIAGMIENESIFEVLKPYFSDRIVYLGERNDVPELFAKSDAFCLPSLWEGLPVTLLESLSVGCIPICSPVGGIKDVIINGENGILSEDATEEGYYCAVKTFIGYPLERVRIMKKNVLATFDKYDMVNCAKEYIRTYNRYLF